MDIDWKSICECIMGVASMVCLTIFWVYVIREVKK